MRSDRGDQIRNGEHRKREEKDMGIRSRGSSVLFLVALVGLLAQAGTATAVSSYMNSFRTTYPTAVGSRIDSCLVCHTTTNASPSTRNVYGSAYGNANHSFTAINAADTDGDGYTNQVEITQFFFPGNAADHPVAATLPTVTIAATDTIATEAGATTGQYTRDAHRGDDRGADRELHGCGNGDSGERLHGSFRERADSSGFPDGGRDRNADQRCGGGNR